MIGTAHPKVRTDRPRGGVLYTNAGNTNAPKALITAEYSGVKLELAKDFQLEVSNYTPEFLKMSPIGMVPVLKTPDGAIFDSNTIARYVAKLKADSPLYGSSLIEYAHIEQWMDFSATEIEAGLGRWIYTARFGFGRTGFNALMCVFATKVLKISLDALNTHLANNTYLVGRSVTLADIVITCDLCWGYSCIMTKAFTSEFPHVERYFWTMMNQPNFKKVIGEVKQVGVVPAVQSQSEGSSQGAGQSQGDETKGGKVRGSSSQG
ncbi:Elongation factor 1-gamma [Rhynchospora pubera]|uniref:Elongation factor 1-gamma n=1 Tax=Rhynchospora pubera TaxID=906938 RepID=A0AAV8DQY7_9POAL|nr:Elongation factor 1-gamma [Rhynchospora pubera]